MSYRQPIGIKKSNFSADSTIPDTATLDFVYNGSNTKITFSDLKTVLGVTGSLNTAGDPLGAPVLSGVAPNYLIRNIESGFGTTASVSAQDGIQIDAVIESGTGDASLVDNTGDNPLIRGLEGAGGIAVSESGDSVTIDGNTLGLTSRVTVKSFQDLQGTLDSTKEYYIDGIIDMGTNSIEVPAGGLSLRGSGLDVSKLISSAENYTMFTSPAGGSGNLLGIDFSMEVTGANSQVFNLTSATGFDAFEFSRINWNNCTSMGEITNYRQGFESGTGRFGGTPELTLSGTWVGGYFIDSSIVRSLDAGFTGSLYKAGAGFAMTSRFRSNQNIDLPASASFFDFSDSNFANPSTVQVQGAILTRNGVTDPEDANITPNITASNLSCAWINNNGMQNTFVGGRTDVTAEVVTTINTIGVFETLAGTFTAADLQHFDSPASGQLRHLGNSPRNFKVSVSAEIVGTSNEDITIRIRKYDDSAATTTTVKTGSRQINNFVGGRDVGFFDIVATLTLDQNDYIFLEIANNSTTANVTAAIDSSIIVEVR